jgi:SAM-dependent methyltransferase
MSSENSPQTQWFENWFNTPYYHILYKNRDDQEAHRFIDNLVRIFDINPTHSVLDVACGKGRFARYLSQVGCEVVGIDISSENIHHASRLVTNKLKFVRGDMRMMEFPPRFDFVLNMFTSFGYFDNENDNINSVKRMVSALRPGGFLILDFFNTEKVLTELPVSHKIEVDGIEFSIFKYTEGKYIVKDISFINENESYHFQERVQALRKEDFLLYFDMAGLKDIKIWGDYDFNPWNTASERTIFTAKKSEKL